MDVIDHNSITDIRKSMRLFLKDVLEIAKKKIKGYEDLPYLLKKPIYNLVDDQPELKYKYIDYNKLSQDIASHIVSYSSYNKLNEQLNVIVNKQRTHEKKFDTLSINTMLKIFINNYLNEYGINFSDDGIEGFIKDFNVRLQGNESYSYLLAPLYNFTNDSNLDLRLTSNIWIRKITSSEYTNIIPPYGYQSFPYKELRFGLIEKLQNEDNVKDTLKRFNDIIHILKMFKSGKPNFWNLYKSVNQITFYPPKLIERNYVQHNTGNKYIIDYEDFKVFYRLYNFIEKITVISKTDYPKPAIRRFGRGLNNEDKNEQIVEFVLALDSLVLLDHSGLNDFSTILPTLLFNKKSNRAHIRKFMKKMYSIRNKYIHNSEYREIKIDEKSISPEKASEELEEYTRMAFLRYLSLLKNKIDEEPDRGLDRIRKEIYKDIEEAIFDQDKLEELQKCWGQFCK